MRPRTACPLVTTRAPIFFVRSQSAALLMLASGAIVATSVPFRLKMLSMDIAASPASPGVSVQKRHFLTVATPASVVHCITNTPGVTANAQVSPSGWYHQAHSTPVAVGSQPSEIDQCRAGEA